MHEIERLYLPSGKHIREVVQHHFVAGAAITSYMGLLHISHLILSIFCPSPASSTRYLYSIILSLWKMKV